MIQILSQHWLKHLSSTVHPL